MTRLRFLTAGESHGPRLVAIIEGLPAGLPLQAQDINAQLARRQKGYGRGARMQIERDQAEILSGVRGGLTLGSPIALAIPNLDWVNWTAVMDPAPFAQEVPPVTRLRPGHADLPGAIKYGHQDVRNVLERASARETAARVAVGAVARVFLSHFGARIYSHVVAIGEVSSAIRFIVEGRIDWEQAEQSPVHCADPEAEKAMLQAITKAKEAGDSLGGIFEIVALGLPMGLGSHVHWDRRLGGRLAMALMSINAVKGVEIGEGFAGTRLPGSRFHDIIEYGPEGWRHSTNRAGGLVGGMTNGEPLVMRAAVKPIATLMRPLSSVDLRTKEATVAHVERSDVCVVPAASVIGEAVVAIVLADAFLEKFGGDSLTETKHNYEGYLGTYRPALKSGAPPDGRKRNL